MPLSNDPYAPVTIGPGEVVPSDQPTAPYLDAVVAYGFRGSTRFHVPGHKAGAGADPGLISAIGEDALMLDVPQDIYGIDLGPEPTPFQRAEQLAAEAHGAARSWFLTNGASQGNHALCLALAPLGTPLVVDQSWGSHFGFHPDLPPSALQQGADAVLTSTHKIVGSLTQSALLHVAGDARLDSGRLARMVRLTRSTSQSALLMASLDAARRQLAVHGEALLSRTIAARARIEAAIAAVPGCEVIGDALAEVLRETPDARAAWIVSPTYYGMAADVAGCAEVCQAAGVPLVVDQAWGSHFGFHPDLPPSALQQGADAVLTSTHKIVGSLTQSAMLHVAPTGRIDPDVVASSTWTS